jgi:hypothetical protein
MTRRRAQHHPEQLPDLCGRQAGRFPEQWAEIDQRELEYRHRQAQLLVAKGHGAVRLEGCSSAGLFDEP